MKILVVDPDQSRAPGLQALLSASGAEVSVAASGSFALTMLEWNRQDVIVSRAAIADMDGPELCSIVRSDPSTRDVRFVLVAAPEEVTPAQTVAAGIDLVLPSSMAGSMMVPLVVQLVRHDGGGTPAHDPPALRLPPAAAMSRAPAPAPVAAADPPAPVMPAVAAPAAAPSMPAPRVGPASSLGGLDSVGTGGAVKTFQGSLEVTVMEELVQAIASGGKTGRLLVVLPVGGGMMLFDAGRVVHAEFGALSGEPAFEALVATAHRARAGKFCFIPGDGRVSCSAAATISKSVDQLLLGIAAAMDEER